MMYCKERAACIQLSINEPPLKDFLCQKGGQKGKALLNTDKTKRVQVYQFYLVSSHNGLAAQQRKLTDILIITAI